MKNDNHETNRDVWTIENPNGMGGCTSSLPYCGYDRKTLTNMVSHGYYPYKNGKKTALPPKSTKPKTTV